MQQIGFSVGKKIFDAIAKGSKTVYFLRAELLGAAAASFPTFQGLGVFINRDQPTQKAVVKIDRIEPNMDIGHMPIGQYLSDLNDQDEHTVIDLGERDMDQAEDGGGVATIAPPIVATRTISFARVPDPEERLIKLTFLSPQQTADFYASEHKK